MYTKFALVQPVGEVFGGVGVHTLHSSAPGGTEQMPKYDGFWVSVRMSIVYRISVTNLYYLILLQITWGSKLDRYAGNQSKNT